MNRIFGVVALILALPLAAGAQEIGVKTVPVATGSQFLLLPSQNVMMGGISIALDDPLYDPFVNPAKGVSVRGVHFTSTPHYYRFNVREGFGGEHSSTRTMPVGILARIGRKFGGAAIAWQEMSRRSQSTCCTAFSEFNNNLTTIERSSISRNNVYAFVTGGLELPGTHLSIGVSAFVAKLRGLEGVQLLYASGDEVEQDGAMSSLRVGLLQRWDDGRTAELVVQRHRFHMEHRMTEWIFEDSGASGAEQVRLEEDATHGWAVRAAFQRPLKDGWRIGGRLAGDWKSHPKIPNYDLMRIPRDPGNTSAYNMGIGISRKVRNNTYGFDLIYEPIRSHTWANALEDTEVISGGSVRKGAMTIENFFRFHNTIARLGVRQAGRRLDFGLGLDLHIYRYRLNQQDFVRQFKRRLDEAWGEWTLSMGLGYDFTGFRLRYLSLLTLGTGQPGIASGVRNVGFAEDLGASSSFVVAPRGALDLADATVWTHRVSLLIPLSSH